MIHGGGANRLKAGVQYVAYNLVGSTLFLFALATIYAVTGTLNMADLAVKVADLPAGDAGRLRRALEEITHQERDVLAPFPECRHPDRHDVQPVEQVFAEAPGADFLLQVPVGRGDDPDGKKIQ